MWAKIKAFSMWSSAFYIFYFPVKSLEQKNVNVEGKKTAAKDLNFLFARCAKSETLPKYVKLGYGTDHYHFGTSYLDAK